MSNFRRKKILETLQNKTLSFDQQDEILAPYEDYLERVFNQFKGGEDELESQLSSIGPKGLAMKRLDEEESNLEESASSAEKVRRSPGLGSGLGFGDNQTVFSKVSKASKRDVDGIKRNKLDLQELSKRIANVNHTHITEKASEYTRKHGLVSFGPKLNRLDALSNQMDREFKGTIKHYNANKLEG